MESVLPNIGLIGVQSHNDACYDESSVRTHPVQRYIDVQDTEALGESHLQNLFQQNLPQAAF